MLEPDLEPLHRLARQIRDPPLPLRIGPTSADQRPAGAIRPELNVPHLERDELPATRERLIRDAEQGAFAIRSQPLARARNELLDLALAQGTRLRLPR